LYWLDKEPEICGVAESGYTYQKVMMEKTLPMQAVESITNLNAAMNNTPKLAFWRVMRIIQNLLYSPLVSHFP
jgi:hypothetical protein